MTQSNETQQRARYDNDAVHEILARAIRIEQGRLDTLSYDELKHAASEIGVSGAALDSAIASYEARAAGVTSHTGKLTRLAAKFALIGGALGVFSEGVISPMMHSGVLGSAPVVGMLVLMISGGLAVTRSRRGARIGVVEFEVRNVGLWAGFLGSLFVIGRAMGGLPAGGFGRGLLLTIGITTWIVASVGGGIVSAWRSRATAHDGSDASPGEPRVSRLYAFKRRTAERLKNWIDAVLTRSRLATRGAIATTTATALLLVICGGPYR
jgi:hypothetical protein